LLANYKKVLSHNNDSFLKPSSARIFAEMIAIDMKYTLFFILFAFGLLGTSCISEEIPEDVLPQEQMRAILKDFHLANAMAQRPGRDLEARKSDREELYSAILSRYDIARKTFFDSYIFYLDHPRILNDMYAKIVEELNEQSTVEQELKYDLMQKQKKKTFKLKTEGQDSLAKINKPTVTPKP